MRRSGLWLVVMTEGICATSGLDPDEWYPVSTGIVAARREAAAAIRVCAACPVRDCCPELSLRYWRVGQHGIWGGTVPAERMALRRRLATASSRDSSASRVASPVPRW